MGNTNATGWTIERIMDYLEDTIENEKTSFGTCLVRDYTRSCN